LRIFIPNSTAATTSMVERADTALRRAAGEFIRSLPDRLKADRRIGVCQYPHGRELGCQRKAGILEK